MITRQSGCPVIIIGKGHPRPTEEARSLGGSRMIPGHPDCRVIILLLLLAGCSSAQLPGIPGPVTHASGLRVSTFHCDATPPIGHRLVGWSVLLKTVEEPLLLKGIVLDDGRTRYVLAALDWCRLQTGA